MQILNAAGGLNPAVVSLRHIINTINAPDTGVAMAVAKFAIKISCTGEPPNEKQITADTAKTINAPILILLSSKEVGLLNPAFNKTTPLCVLPSSEENPAPKRAMPMSNGISHQRSVK